jgi:hypothetical protein
MHGTLIYLYLQTMETIPKSDCQKIGFIRKTHGVHGELVLEYEPEFEESVVEAERFFLEIDGLLVPFFVAEEGLRFRSAKTALITFDWVELPKNMHAGWWAVRFIFSIMKLLMNPKNRQLCNCCISDYWMKTEKN